MNRFNQSARGLTIAIWYALTAVLAVSTFCVPTSMYGSRWMVGLWIAVGALTAAAIFSRQMRSNHAAQALHGALLLILAGGAITWLTSEKGTLILEPGVTTDTYINEEGRQRELGATVSLDSFVVERHAGIESPMDYRSYLHVDGREAIVAVNKPLTVGSARLYQSSYGENGVSVLSVNRDLAGMTVSYAGYLLLGIGWIMVMCRRSGRFRSIVRQLSVVALLIVAGGGHAKAVDGISEEQAARMKLEPVLYQGRVTPFNTPATELVRKLTGDSKFGGQSAERITASLIMYPEQWRRVKLIYVKDKQLRERLGMSGSYVSAAELFDDEGNYRLAPLYGGTDKGMDRAILEVDEKLELMALVQGGRLFDQVPEGMAQPSRLRMQLEVAYNTLPVNKTFFMAMLTIAIAGLVVSSMSDRCRTQRIFRWLMGAGVAAVVWQTAGYGLRWMVAGRVPLGTGGETLMFVSILLGIAGTWCGLTGRRMIGSATLLMSGFAGLVAWLAMRDPSVTPLMPVLNSPWLAIHVSLVMTAYSLLAMTSAVAAVGLARPSERMVQVCIALLYPALALLSAGIFTGAVWAGESWGRYWAWDPKETWALITLMVYVVALHRSAGLQQKPRAMMAYLLVAFATVVMTYWGVNYLPSLHAYQ